jgi:ABC-type proline/glycine betaine transport system permease subunit
MIPLLLLGGLLAGAAIIAVTFWDQIKKYLQMALTKVKQVLTAAIIGVAAYVQSGDWREGIRAAYKFYSKDEKGMWQETVTTKTITADEVPEHIRKQLERSSNEIDISNELKLELK